MTDDEESEEPAVVLGTRREVDGAPLARVSARLMWGIEKSAIVEREGETEIRTPDGPQQLTDLLGAVDKQYFATRQEFEDAVEKVIGDGPVPTAASEDDSAAETTTEDGTESADSEEPNDSDDDDETAVDDDLDDETADDDDGDDETEDTADSDDDTDEGTETDSDNETDTETAFEDEDS